MNLKNVITIDVRNAFRKRGLQLDPQIIKVKKIIGKSISLRDATVEDAEFIYALRADKTRNQFINSVNSDLGDQLNWLRSYENDNKQAYFLIEDDSSLEPFGTIRIYDQRGKSFCWGSWVLKDNTPSAYAIESALLVYCYALLMGFDGAHFDVRKRNRSVWKFHERFGAVKVSETSEDFYYTINYESILSGFSRYSKYLPEQIYIIGKSSSPAS